VSSRLGLSQRQWVIALGILAVALAVRLGVVAATPDYPLISDPAGYHEHGISIANGNGYPESDAVVAGGPSALRAPLYPYFVGAVYAVAGPDPNAARLVQAFVGTVTVALIGLLALQLWNPIVALISMGISAVYPSLLISGGALITESLFLPFMLGAVSAAIQHRRSSHRWRWAIAAGVLVGLATLDRPNGFVLVLPIALALWDGPSRWSLRSLAQPVVAVFAVILVVLPWTIRNAIEMNSFIPITTQGGVTLSGTYNSVSHNDPEHPGAWRPPTLIPEYEPLLRRPDISEAELTDALQARARHYIEDHPLYPIEVAFRNTMRMLNLTGFSWAEMTVHDVGFGKLFADLSVVSFWILLSLAVFGALMGQLRGVPPFIWLALVLLWLSVVLITGNTRHRIPLEPFLVMFAAIPLAAAYDRFRAAWPQRLGSS
jgi:4-amino-4-deoxy-L-arabinose transferase-like glycosyltransferase